MPYSPDHKKGTRQRIVKAAAHVFNKRGFSEATIEEIMTAAGLTHGGFYRHFHSKDELMPKLSGTFCTRTCGNPGRNRDPSCVIQTCSLEDMWSTPTFRGST